MMGVTMQHKVKFLTPEEFRALDGARIALAKQRGQDPEWLKANNSTYGWARFDEVSDVPCIMWQVPWYHDPAEPGAEEARQKAIAAITAEPGLHWHLSIHYWRDWAHIRPPLCVICPGGDAWCVDAKSSNGDGWTVTFDGDWKGGLIRCSPSILVSKYHGFLGSNGAPAGYFSDPV